MSQQKIINMAKIGFRPLNLVGSVQTKLPSETLTHLLILYWGITNN